MKKIITIIIFLCIPLRAQHITVGNVNGMVYVGGNPFNTIQSAVNNFPSGNGSIMIPPGTYSSSTCPVVQINGNSQSNIRLEGAGRNVTIIQYTGAAACTAVVDIGTSSPTVNTLFNLLIRDLTIRGNANATHALRLQGVGTSTIQNVSGRDVTGSALQWLYGVGNIINGWVTSPSDGLGSFSPQPTNGIELGEIGSTAFGFTSTTVVTPRVEGVSGSGMFLHNVQFTEFSGCQISTNGSEMDLENGVTQGSQGNTFNSCFFEASTGSGDSVTVNASANSFYGTIGADTKPFHIKAAGYNTIVENGVIGSLTIDSTSLNNRIAHVILAPANFTDNGTNTQLANNIDPATAKQWAGTTAVFKQVIPGFTPTIGGGAYDPLDHFVQGCYNLSTTPTILSPTPLTTAKPWRLLVTGVWENNVDGTGLNQIASLAEVTNVSNTLVIGSVTLTFSVNGSGQLQVVTGANSAAVCMTLWMNSAPNETAGTASLLMKDNVSAANYTATTNGGVVMSATNGSDAIFRGPSAGQQYYMDAGFINFRDSNGAAGAGGLRWGSTATKLAIGFAAPTLTSGFNTGTMTTTNGTLSFVVTVGTGAAGSTGVIGLPTSTTGWNCWLTNQTRADLILQTANSTASATFTNFGTTFAATNFTNSDVLVGGCAGN